MTNKKMQTIFSLIEIAETNLKNAKNLLQQMIDDGSIAPSRMSEAMGNSKISKEEEQATEVVEGYFDGEYMIGDNGRTYLVPQNYASKTQLVVGDRMKWILTPTREIFKLIQPAPREKVEGVFGIDGDSYIVNIEGIQNPVRILKASATFAMKTQDLKPGDIVSILIPRDTTPIWGAFLTVVKGGFETGTERNNNYSSPKLDIFDNIMDATDNKKSFFDDDYL
jgi:hypothetical protein